MIVCPVCEHVQGVGDACDVCGHRLPGGAAPVPLPLDALEPTSWASVAVDAELLPGLEPTAATPVGVVDVAPLLGLEPTAAEPVRGDEPATAAPTACRYCRAPSAPGERICGRCGMRLTVPARRAVERADPTTRCGCGTRVTGAVCPACGARSTAR